MSLLLKIIQICLITTIIQEATNYVLLAADLEDFRTIAKKFVPDELADELAQIASQAAIKQKQRNDDYYSNDNSEQDNDESQLVTAVQQMIRDRNHKQKLKIQEKLPKINSEVVEKVKENLSSEYAYKYEESTQNKQLYVYVPNKQKHRQNQEYDGDTTPHAVRTTRVYKKQFQDTAFHSKSSKNYNKLTTPYYNKWNDKERQFEKTNVKVKKEIDDDKGKDEPFKEMDLMKAKDSYEDYVTPKKEHIFESAETTKKITPKETRFVKVKNKPEKITLSKWEKIGDKRIRSKKKTLPDYDYEDDLEEKQEGKYEAEIKARTESLLYDERHQKAKIDGQAKLKGTNKPKRDYYKLSSPNYSTFPNVAEKYDFNEPIPEKDREPENYNPVGNPSALINKKIRLI